MMGNDSSVATDIKVMSKGFGIWQRLKLNRLRENTLIRLRNESFF